VPWAGTCLAPTLAVALVRPSSRLRLVDHALDAPLIAKHTQAPPVESASTANIGRGYGLPDEAGPAAAGDTVELVLAEQQAGSRYWADDATLRAGLREEPIYKTLSRRRGSGCACRRAASKAGSATSAVSA
jgi:hypothetical protein